MVSDLGSRGTSAVVEDLHDLEVLLEEDHKEIWNVEEVLHVYTLHDLDRSDIREVAQKPVEDNDVLDIQMKEEEEDIHFRDKQVVEVVVVLDHHVDL